MSVQVAVFGRKQPAHYCANKNVENLASTMYGICETKASADHYLRDSKDGFHIAPDYPSGKGMKSLK